MGQPGHGASPWAVFPGDRDKDRDGDAPVMAGPIPRAVLGTWGMHPLGTEGTGRLGAPRHGVWGIEDRDGTPGTPGGATSASPSHWEPAPWCQMGTEAHLGLAYAEVSGGAHLILLDAALHTWGAGPSPSGTSPTAMGYPHLAIGTWGTAMGTWGQDGDSNGDRMGTAMGTATGTATGTGWGHGDSDGDRIGTWGQRWGQDVDSDGDTVTHS